MSTWTSSNESAEDAALVLDASESRSGTGGIVHGFLAVAGAPAVRNLAVALCIAAGVHRAAHPLSNEPTLIMTQIRNAQDRVNEMIRILGIDADVRVVAVVYHPLVFSVEPVDRDRKEFDLSVELGFLAQLGADELRAALAHELGHVWIFTHHPFLQTERLANDIARPLADRASFEQVYAKLWTYEGSPGVPIEDLLGPAPDPEAGH